MSIFKKNKNYPLGVDVSDSSIRFAQLNKGLKNRIGLRAFGSIDLSQGLISEGIIKNEEEVVKSLKKIFSSSRLSKPNSSEVIASLPENKTFVKLIKIQKSTNKLEDVVEAELEKHIPFHPREIYYDWQEIRKGKDHHLVLVGAAPRSVVDQYYDVFSRSGLTLVALEIEPIAVCRSILDEETPEFQNTKGKNHILIDFGFSHTTIIFYSRDTVLFTSETQMSGEKITQEIAGSLKVGRKKAEKYKLSLSKKNKNYKKIVKIIDSNMEELNVKLGRVIDFYYENFSERGPIESVFFVGGGAYIPKIEDYISCLPASVNIDKGDPLSKISQGEKAKKIFQEEGNLTFTVAVGLALSQIFIKKF